MTLERAAAAKGGADIRARRIASGSLLLRGGAALLVLNERPAECDVNVARLRTSAFHIDPERNVDAALASATRELLRMSEMVEVMLQPVMEILQSGDKVAVHRVKSLEAEADQANRDIKLFLTRLDWDNMDGVQTRRASALTSFATGLEQAGDIVARQLLRVADQKLDGNLGFRRRDGRN